MIELKKVCAGYGSREVLHEISLNLEPGKITVLVGPNGCGKSTLLKTLVRLVDCKSGEILIDEKPLNAWKTTELARAVSYLPQNKKAPDISVLRMVLHGRFAYLNYPRRYREQDVQIARRALHWAGIQEQEEMLVSQLSGGMQQRVYIAMALAQDTGTILLDEPTTYLDVEHQLRMMELAKKLRSEGKAVVMVLHDLSQALRIADHVAVLENGYLKAEGIPEEIVKSGVLQEIFRVELERIQTKHGWRYYCSL